MNSYFTETLDNNIIIRIHNLMPKKIGTGESYSNLKDGFLLMVRENRHLMAIQDLGFEPNEEEINNMEQYISAWGGGENISIQNGILEMEIPQFLLPFADRIFDEPGCRITPNLLRIGGDVFLSVEYPQCLAEKVAGIVDEFMGQDHLFKKEITYVGKKQQGIPVLLRMYKEAGHELSDFVMVTTVWELDESIKRDENQGVFGNRGNYVPKGFVNDSNDKLIFRKDDREIHGFADHTVVDPVNNIVEFSVSSNFFTDFFNRVAKIYTGPIFMHPVVEENRQITYLIVEKRRQEIFLRGLQEHWKLEARREHTNLILSVERLDHVHEEFEERKQKGHST